jgi:predicted GTPase
VHVQTYRLIDTAGIRRRTAVASAGSRSEYLSINRAFRAIRRCDVVALVIDAMQCVTEQVGSSIILHEMLTVCLENKDLEIGSWHYKEV